MRQEPEDRPRSRDPVTQRLLDLLYQARKDRGWTVRDVAKAAGISPSYVSLIENGHKIPDAGTIEKLGRALGLDEKLLSAWVTVRGRSTDARESIGAAYELSERLGIFPDSVEPEFLLGSLSPPRSADSPVLESAASPLRASPLRAYSRELGPDLPDADRYVIGIRMVDEGTEPQPDEPAGKDRRPLWIDRRSLPERDELRGAFAWRLSTVGLSRLRGVYRRGDMVVISPESWSPDRIDERMVFAIRHEGAVLLSRVSWTREQLILHSTGPAPTAVISARGEKELRSVIAGRVIVAVQRFR